MVSVTLPEFSATVDQVTSGDDIVLFVDLKIDDLYKKVRARLEGVDTPDAYKANRDSDAGKIREQVRSLTRNNECTIQVHNQGRGGWKVTLIVHTSDGDVNLNDLLRKQGYVYPRESNDGRQKAQKD